MSKKDSRKGKPLPKPQQTIERRTYIRQQKPRVYHLGDEKIPFPDNPEVFYVYGETLTKNTYQRSVIFGPTRHVRINNLFVFAGEPEEEQAIAWFDKEIHRWIIRNDPNAKGYCELLITTTDPPQVGNV